MNYKWYILYVSTGQEYKVRDEINKLTKIDEDIKESFVPVVKTFKISKGKKVDDEKKMFPNYVFVNMDFNKNSYTKIKSISKVLNFLGSKTRPQEVTEEKIIEYKKRSEENNSFLKSSFDIGDMVKIIEGPFDGFIGTIESESSEKNVLKISLSIFGRTTLVDIESDRVEKVN